MAVIKKTDLEKLTPEEKVAKIAELEKLILELHGEGSLNKVKPLRKAIAQLKTPKEQRVKKA